MSDTCPTCGLVTKPEGEPWHEGKHCPRRFTRPGNTGTTQAAAERDCLELGLERRDAALATTKAQLDRSRLLLIKSRDALDLAIGVTQQQTEAEHG